MVEESRAAPLAYPGSVARVTLSMDRRRGIALGVVVAVLLLPVLCLGGFLGHGCGWGGVPCDHDTCAADPCGVLTRSVRSDDGVPDLMAPVLSAIVSRVDLELAPSERHRRRRQAEPPPRTLACHASDVPLRI